MTSKLLILFLALLVLAGCGGPDCSEGSEKASLVRALSQERFSDLLLYSKGLDSEQSVQHHHDLEKNPLPSEISDLPVKLVRVNEKQVLYRLEGCFDHHLDLVVLKDGKDSPRIELRSEEVPRIIEVLWQKEN